MPSTRKRGDSWYYIVEAGPDPRTGKRKQITKGGFPSEKEALFAGMQVEKEIERGTYTKAPKLSEFFDTFFEDHVKHQVSDMTYHNQKQWAEKYIIPSLGRFPMDKITHVQIEQFYSDLLKQNVSRGTIRNIALVLRKAFRTAQKWQLIYQNVMQHATPPKYKPAIMKVWNVEQAQEFLEKSKGSPYHTLYVLALSTGARIGEMLGLYWSDIDFDSGMLTINRSLKYSMQQGLHVKEPKNEHSKRTIAIPQSTLDILQRHKETTLPAKYIFHTFGEPIYPNEASRRFKYDVKKAGMPMIRFHDMRHTHATLLLQMGTNPKVVAERLGHSTITTTLDTYSHVMPSMQKEVAAALEGKLFNL